MKRCLLSCLLFLLISAAHAFAQAIPLVESGHSRSVIVYPEDDNLSARTAKKLADYIRSQTDVEVPIAAANAFQSPDRDTAIIVIDGTTDHHLASKLGATVQLSSDRQDAYRLTTSHHDNASPLILAIGQSPAGAKYAAYRLMRELTITGRNASIRALDVHAEPFIKTRSIALFNVWNMPIEVTRRHNIESWPADRIERYVDMYDFFGFNAIESHDRFNDNYLTALFGLTRAQWSEKVLKIADSAHANGQKMFLRIWGHVVLETPALAKPLGPNDSVAKKLIYLCPNDPTQRKRWETEILHYYVDHYAGRIDHLIGHWCDPGICRENGCTFKTPLQLQMELHNAFKTRDPHFESSFNLWFFDKTKDNPAHWARGGWPGYQNDLDLINAGILSKDVTVATATSLPGSYQEDVVQAILVAGHKPAVWTWYRADHEIRPSLHVHLHERLGEYFSTLPPSARQLDWHGIERNVHGAANTANYYVAGRLMWEPTLNVDDLLKEFLTLTFGPDNADKVLPAYLAIESIRCNACYKNWEQSRFTGAGTDDPRADAATARAALAKLSQVQLNPDFRPRLPLDISPAQILTDLTASLEVIRDFADCRANDLPAAQTALKSGHPETATQLLDALTEKYKGWSQTLAGRQEWSVLNDRIKSLRNQIKAASK